LSTDYSNLGDHALSFAHEKFLKDQYPDAEIIEITVGDTIKYLSSIKNKIKSGDVVTLKGGGNIGLEYFREELYRREIVNKIQNNRIVIFPQTVYFPNNRLGEKEFKSSMKIYKNNPNTYLVTRDSTSYKTVVSYLDKHVILTPDIVFYLNDIITPSYKRKGAMVVMRSDPEGKYTKQDKNLLLSLLKDKYRNVVVTDMTTDYTISPENRTKKLQKN